VVRPRLPAVAQQLTRRPGRRTVGRMVIEATLGVAGPAMDPRRQVYADFPSTSGDLETDDQPDADERPAQRRSPKRPPR
jgi:hypothetical protein